MTHLSQTLLAIACLVIAISSLLAIFHPSFEDTLLQRGGLCFAGSGATLTVCQLIIGSPADRAVVLTLVGSAMYAAATVLKLGRRFSLPLKPPTPEP